MVDANRECAREPGSAVGPRPCHAGLDAGAMCWNNRCERGPVTAQSFGANAAVIRRQMMTNGDKGVGAAGATGAPERRMMRHMVATLAYRGGKAVRDAPDGFAEFRAGDTSRTPVRILAHVGDLLDWALEQTEGRHTWHDSQPLPWDDEVKRFFAALERLDRRFAADDPPGYPAERIFQGAIADALTHIGQIAMLRRLAGSPIRGESYFNADIRVGRVGPEQTAPRFEFD